MKNLWLWLVFCFGISAQVMAEDNLFSRVKLLEYDNGFTAVLAPSEDSRLINIELEVDVGWDVETSNNFGVSHLLEHALFRDSRLAENLTYLQLIEEKGGSANGFTYPRKTVFKASIGKAKGPWLLDQFYKMLHQRKFLQDHIDKEKDAVLLEIGKPGVLAEVLGFDLWSVIKPRNLNLPDFWESEFSVKLDNQDFTREEERLSTIRLRADQINKHYHDFYHPANMKIFVAGQFDKDYVENKISQTWGKLAKRSDGKKMPPIGEPVPALHPYIKTKITNDNPSITYGTKVWNLSRLDEEILESYTNFLSHHLMKELRNKKGQTYSVVASNSFQDRFGYSLLSFSTPKENFKENFSLLKNIINNHVQNGLSETEFNDAKTLYLQKFDLTDGNSDTMMRIANLYYYFHKQYKDTRSPYDLLTPIDLASYNERIKSLFSSERRYSYNYVAPYFFRHENIFALVCMVFFMVFGVQKHLQLKPFDHHKIHWMRNVRYLPFKTVEIGITAVICYVFVYFEFYLIDMPFYKLSFLSDSLFYSEYLPSIFSIVLFTYCLNYGYAIFPKRAYIVGDKLILKSLTYFSYHIPLDTIAEVEARFPYKYPFPLKDWKPVGWRFFYYGPPWKPGLLLKLKNGHYWFLGISEAEKAVKELKVFLNPSENQKKSA